MSASKDEIRTQAISALAEMSSGWRQEASRQITMQVIASDCFRKARTIGCYLSFGREVETAELIDVALQAGRRVAAPRYSPESGQWHHCSMERADACELSKWGVPEPCVSTVVPRDELDLIVVPGLGFDGSGARIGRGKGHYDAMLEGFSGVLIGLAFDCQIFESVPVEAHDIAMHYLATPQKLISCAP